MIGDIPFKTPVCRDYECLLLLSKAIFEDFRAKREEFLHAGRNDQDAIVVLQTLREEYEEVCSRLITHYDGCGMCQCLSELASQERYEPSIPFRRRPA